ncbi:MAG: RNA 2',3'-cyclic phosphodiesterase [Thermoplasmata archaeon]|jgi:2'-5' RNA ligase|nr:RNA 2',3'-cyclic phosphodiesterase [Thermoplasmata archaeon]MVT13549.1 RNA 2',3'-cyclic phosphodiesterase [Euryarchaeota archaeon]MVT14127.1 RNA 2',3'-cyclic phosphodiesterase [Euryarchaeota archaeon]MVT35828.1 RNA 2',3'-cyclic phosphodiesterase [Euryarchaeota archaeon]
MNEKNKKLRLFAGIPIKPNQKILEIQEFFRNKYKIKLVEPENLHITLKFIGEVDEGELEKIDSILSSIKISQFSLMLKGAGAFPNEKKARVLWIGIISEELNKLGNEVSDKLSFYNEERFSPHLTIGRLKEISNLSEDLKAFKNTEFGIYPIDHFSLYKSTLKPDGPVYEEIKKYFLK